MQPLSWYHQQKFTLPVSWVLPVFAATLESHTGLPSVPSVAFTSPVCAPLPLKASKSGCPFVVPL